MVSIGRLVYNITGVMTKKGIMKNCEKIGCTLADEIQQTNGKVEISRVSKLLEQTIGKKKASKIIISDDFQSFNTFAKENLKMTEESIQNSFEHSKSTVVPPGKNGKTLLSLRINDATPTDALNTLSHELEHVLYNNVSSYAKIRNIYLKRMSQKQYEQLINSTSDYYNDTMTDFQLKLLDLSKLGKSALSGITEYKAGLSGLLKQTGFKSREKLHETIRTIIRQDVLLPHCNLDNFSLLKTLLRAIQDEARAYKVGGTVQRYADSSNSLTKSEMFAQLYNEAAIVLKEEVKNQKKNLLRIICGKQPIDYHIPKPSVFNNKDSNPIPLIYLKNPVYTLDKTGESKLPLKGKDGKPFTGFL